MVQKSAEATASQIKNLYSVVVKSKRARRGKPIKFIGKPKKDRSSYINNKAKKLRMLDNNDLKSDLGTKKDIETALKKNPRLFSKYLSISK